MNNLKNLFGQPGQGIHSTRILGMAAVDLGLTVVAAYLLSRWREIPFLYSFFGLFLAGEVIHYVLGVKTAVIKEVDKVV